MRLITLTLVAAIALTGCGRQATQPVSAAPNSPPADGGYYNDPRDILTKADDAIPCPDLEDTGAIGARAQISCRQGDILIRVYDTREQIDRSVNLLRLVGGHLLVGRNWTISADQATVTVARNRLGGEIVDVNCRPPDCLISTP